MHHMASLTSNGVKVCLSNLSEVGFDPNLTPSKASLLLALFPNQNDWMAEAEKEAVSNYVAQSIEAAGGILPMVPAPDAAKPRKDPREGGSAPSGGDAKVIKVFTDMVAPVRECQRRDIEWTEYQDGADVWLCTKPIQNYLALPEDVAVTQFPYEGGFVRKDLLPLTIRRFCFSTPGDPSSSPDWWLPCFDLSTEFHLFAQEFQQRSSSGADNIWIVKPAIGTHGVGHKIVRTITEAAIVVQSGGGDRVAQLLVARPLCALTRSEESAVMADESIKLLPHKFDLRVFVMVRSFGPDPDIYRNSHIYARLASHGYDPSVTSDLVQITSVGARDSYDYFAGEKPSVDIADDDGQNRLLWSELCLTLERNRPGFDCAAVLESLDLMIGDIFGKGAEAIGGPWPRSRAYYGIDVILDDCAYATSGEPKSIMVPKLVEVNFMADWDVAIVALKQGGQPEMVPIWVDDMVAALCTNDDLSGNERFTKISVVP